MFQPLAQLVCEIRYYFNRLGNNLSLKNKTTGAKLPIYQVEAVSVEANASLKNLEFILKHILCGTPYWSRGHLELAEVSLASGDIELSYSSVQAVLQLNAKSKSIKKAKHILAKIYLKYRNFIEAATLLEEQLVSDNESVPLRSDLAAALIALGKYEQAIVVLQAIKEKQITAEIQTMLEFLKHKTST